jgi:peroxiredoxin
MNDDKGKSKKFPIVLILVVVLILSWYLLYKFIQENRLLRSSLPYLLMREKIEYFDLVDMDANEINSSVLKGKAVSVIFIFKPSCSPCDKNVIFYKKIANILRNNDRISFYGIVLNNANKAVNFAEEAQLPFKVYIPQNLKKFRTKMRVKLNLAQIIVYTDKVEFLRLGELSSTDAVKILEMIKKLA